MSYKKFYWIKYLDEISIAEKSADSNLYLLTGTELTYTLDQLQWIGPEIPPFNPQPINSSTQPISPPDWNKVDAEGYINIPDHLDDAVNKVLHQFAFVQHSEKNTVQAACDIVHGLEQFFTKK